MLILPTRAFSSACCLTSWDVMEPLNRLNPWEMAQQVNDPLPEAIGTNALHWTHSTHLALSTAAVKLHVSLLDSSVAAIFNWQPPMLAQSMCFKSWEQSCLCPPACYTPHLFTLCCGSNRKLKGHSPLKNVLSSVIYDYSTHHYTSSIVRCFQHPAFLCRTSPLGGNEVMLYRNLLIY